MQKRNLILLTSSFPYGTGETFLENEIDYLCQGFEKVTIIAMSRGNNQMRSVPSNCSVLSFHRKISSLDKIIALKGIFTAYFWKEIKIIRKTYQKPLTKGILATLLVSLSQAQKIVQFLKRSIAIDDNTVLYSYWCDDSAIALAMLKKEYPRTKMLSRMHGWDIYFEESKVDYLPFRYFVTNQLSLFSISEDGIRYAMNNWKVNSSDLHLSRLGTIAHFPKITERTLPLFTIVSCSNIIPVKRVHLIAEALQKITDISISWIHFGDGALMETLKNNIKSLPSNIQVELKGRVPNPAIYQAYHELKPHLFINVSSSEGVPVSIMEAMSFGIPVVATDVGGNREIVNDKNGLLLSAHPTTQEIESAIREFLEMDKEKFDKFTEFAYQTWKEKYNAERNYTEFVELIK